MYKMKIIYKITDQIKGKDLMRKTLTAAEKNISIEATEIWYKQ